MSVRMWGSWYNSYRLGTGTDCASSTAIIQEHSVIVVSVSVVCGRTSTSCVSSTTNYDNGYS